MSGRSQPASGRFIEGPFDAAGYFMVTGGLGIIPTAIWTNVPKTGGLLVAGSFFVVTMLTDDLLKHSGLQGTKIKDRTRWVLNILAGTSASVLVPTLAGYSVTLEAALIISAGLFGEFLLILALLIAASKIIELSHRSRPPQNQAADGQ